MHEKSRGSRCVAGAGTCSRARLDGYRGALESAGAEMDDDLVREGDFSNEPGFAQGAALPALDTPPTAVLASSDRMALRVYEAARTLLRLVDGGTLHVPRVDPRTAGGTGHPPRRARQFRPAPANGPAPGVIAGARAIRDRPAPVDGAGAGRT